MDFIFQFLNMVYHIDWFLYIKESLHPWNKPNLIMVYELLDVLLNCLLKFCWGFLHLCSSVIYWPVIFFFVVSLYGFCIRVMVVWKNEFGSFPSSATSEEFQKDRCSLFSKCLIEFTCEAIRPWTFVCRRFLNCSFNFSTCNWCVHIFCFLLVQSFPPGCPFYGHIVACSSLWSFVFLSCPSSVLLFDF